MTDFDTRKLSGPPQGGTGRRAWIRVPLAAGAGLVSLVVCFGAFYATYRYEYELYIYNVYPFNSSITSLQPLAHVALYTMILAGASLTLPPLALGARLVLAVLTSVFCSCGFATFMSLYFSLHDLPPYWDFHALNKLVLNSLALMVLVGTSAVGSLVAVQGEGRMAARMLPATLIAAVTLYGASSFAYWLVLYGERRDLVVFAPIEWSNLPILAPIVVAAFAWPVLPGIVAWLRSD